MAATGPNAHGPTRNTVVRRQAFQRIVLLVADGHRRHQKGPHPIRAAETVCRTPRPTAAIPPGIRNVAATGCPGNAVALIGKSNTRWRKRGGEQQPEPQHTPHGKPLVAHAELGHAAHTAAQTAANKPRFATGSCPRLRRNSCLKNDPQPRPRGFRPRQRKAKQAQAQ